MTERIDAISELLFDALSNDERRRDFLSSPALHSEIASEHPLLRVLSRLDAEQFRDALALSRTHLYSFVDVETSSARKKFTEKRIDAFWRDLLDRCGKLSSFYGADHVRVLSSVGWRPDSPEVFVRCFAVHDDFNLECARLVESILPDDLFFSSARNPPELDGREALLPEAAKRNLLDARRNSEIYNPMKRNPLLYLPAVLAFKLLSDGRARPDVFGTLAYRINSPVSDYLRELSEKNDLGSRHPHVPLFDAVGNFSSPYGYGLHIPSYEDAYSLSRRELSRFAFSTGSLELMESLAKKDNLDGSTLFAMHAIETRRLRERGEADGDGAIRVTEAILPFVKGRTRADIAALFLPLDKEDLPVFDYYLSALDDAQLPRVASLVAESPEHIRLLMRELSVREKSAFELVSAESTNKRRKPTL